MTVKQTSERIYTDLEGENIVTVTCGVGASLVIMVCHDDALDEWVEFETFTVNTSKLINFGVNNLRTSRRRFKFIPLLGATYAIA